MTELPNNEILIYKTLDGKTKIETKLQNETVWLTIEQMSELFQKSRSTINEHILNIYKENELSKDDSMRKIGNSDFSTKPTMYMKDWIIKLDDFLKMTGKNILDNAGKISHKMAIEKANMEYETYKEKTKDELSKIEKDFIEYIEQTAKLLKK